MCIRNEPTHCSLLQTVEATDRQMQSERLILGQRRAVSDRAAQQVETGHDLLQTLLAVEGRPKDVEVLLDDLAELTESRVVDRVGGTKSYAVVLFALDVAFYTRLDVVRNVLVPPVLAVCLLQLGLHQVSDRVLQAVEDSVVLRHRVGLTAKVGGVL